MLAIMEFNFRILFRAYHGYRHFIPHRNIKFCRNRSLKPFSGELYRFLPRSSAMQAWPMPSCSVCLSVCHVSTLAFSNVCLGLISTNTLNTNFSLSYLQSSCNQSVYSYPQPYISSTPSQYLHQ